MESQQKIQGYIFITDNNIEFSNAKAGDRIIKPDRKPPYFVVDHFLHKVILHQWPGKFYKVEVLEEDKEEEGEINKGLVKDVSYTRTFGVEILEELPLSSLFEQHGNEICKLADLATRLTSQNAELLNKYSLDSNRILYSKVWKSWVALTDKENSSRSDDWRRTLAAHPKNQKLKSPIGNGLSLIWNQCYKQARMLEGDEAIDTDEDGEISLKPKWAIAAEHLICAAISYEPYNILTPEEKIQLREPVASIFR